jgi:uncharacterized protein (TIGR03000 family)
MYSVVMMMALSGGAEVPDFHGRWRGCGCCGGRVVARHSGWRHGCCGCTAYYGGCVGCAGCVGGVGMTPTMSAGAMAFIPDGMTFYPRPGPFLVPKDEVQNVNFQKTETNPAVIVVTVPADSKVTFNGWTSSSNSTTRRFKTPDLEPGKEYAYTLRAEITRNGQTLVQTHQVVVRAGQETEVPIRFAEVALTQFEQ